MDIVCKHGVTEPLLRLIVIGRFVFFVNFNTYWSNRLDPGFFQICISLFFRIPDVGIEWPSIDPSKEGLTYMHIKGPGQFEIKNNTNLGEKKFWSAVGFSENKLAGNYAVVKS